MDCLDVKKSIEVWKKRLPNIILIYLNTGQLELAHKYEAVLEEIQKPEYQEQQDLHGRLIVEAKRFNYRELMKLACTKN